MNLKMNYNSTNDTDSLIDVRRKMNTQNQNLYFVWVNFSIYFYFVI